MAQRPAQHTDLRKAGLAAAMVVGLLLAAGFAVVVFTRKQAPATAGNAPPTTPQPESTPDISDAGPQTGNARVQFADKRDPGRAAGMIEWAKLDPVSQTEKRLTDPRGYVYMRDGGLVIVSSKSGRLHTTPKVQEPRSGRFEGGVTLQLFPAGTDPKADKPTLTATSDSLDFDIPSASMTTAGKFTLRSTAFDIDGSGMHLVANQLEEGIERFEVAHVDSVVIRPDAKDPLQSGGLTNTEPARAVPGATKGPDRLRTYHAVIDGAVKLVQGKRVMTADRADAWAHMVNNRLPEGAIGRLGPDPALISAVSTEAEAAKAAHVTAPGAATPGEKAAPLAPVEDTAITGTWTGRLVVTPVAETGEGSQPPEFGANKAALRLQSDKKPVSIGDEGFKGTLTAAQIDFGATERVLTLRSSPTIPVHIQTASAGGLECRNAKVDLGTGQVDIAGPGKLVPAAAAVAKAGPAAAPPTPAVPPTPSATLPPETILTFAQALTLKFKSVGNWITPDANTATIAGGFNATSGEVNASGDEATVVFNPRVNDKSTIKEIVLRGNAVASAPAAARVVPSSPAPAKTPAAPSPGVRDKLQGDQMTFRFDADPATGHEIPKSVEVSGNAQATAGGTGDQGLNLKARTITADLGKQKDQIVVIMAEAKDEVYVTGNPGAGGGPGSVLLASGQHLTVDPAAGVALLKGGPGGGAVTISRDNAVMTGPSVRITQSTGEVFVDGAGTIIAENLDAKATEKSSAYAAWSKSMTFNNVTGQATCLGNATATMTTGETEKNTAQAETIVLTFTPAPTADVKPAPSTPHTPGTPAPQRELVTAEAIGQPGVDGKPPRPATLEHREFALVNGVRTLTQLTYLEGQKILANQPKRTLEVPVSGKLLVDDRTPEPPKAGTPAPPAPESSSPIGGFTSAKGTSLFSWKGSLHLDMNKGQAVLDREVALTHQALSAPGQPTPPQTTLDCDRLTAFLKVPPQGAAPSNSAAKLDATLERVEARGNVITRSEGKQLTADSLTFDTVRQFIEAAGSNDAERTLVAFLDPSKPAPLRARKISWDQKNGEIRIIEPAPTTIGN